MAEIKPSEVSAIIRQQLANFSDKKELEETGVILEVGDGIARVYALDAKNAGGRRKGGRCGRLQRRGDHPGACGGCLRGTR